MNPQEHVGAGIAVDAKYSPWVWGFVFLRPKILVNNAAVPGKWGRTVLPAYPGRYHVHVHVPYIVPPRLGSADTIVDVYPGQITELEYRAPLWSFSRGSLGVGPQPYNGGRAVLVVAVAAFVIGLLAAVLLIAAA